MVGQPKHANYTEWRQGPRRIWRPCARVVCCDLNHQPGTSWPIASDADIDAWPAFARERKCE
jgi:hypothetical protein